MSVHAAIDVGTNSVLLLIGRIENGELNPLLQESRITRLGEGLSETGMLSGQAMNRTAQALGEYVKLCSRHGAQSITAVGTAAMRKATNSADFIGRVHGELGIDIEVIGEKDEARLTHLGSSSSFGSDIVVMDIGGGSTEFIARDASSSLDIGVVILKERFFHSDPPADEEISAARRDARELFSRSLDTATFSQSSLRLVAAAGTATTLAAMHGGVEPYDAGRVHGTTLTTSDVQALIERMRKLKASDILKLKGVQEGREDVILPGALLMAEAMEHLGYDEALVSDRGVRWGVLIDKFTRLSF
jgi:exopolyphosphatase/guanosine-5'-triphosphate,3'-diphosphate pyrophosphatase